jgi:hypothetical protein
MMKWLKNLFGGSDSSSEATEPVSAPEPETMPAEAPPVPVETAEPTGDEPEQPS